MIAADIDDLPSGVYTYDAQRHSLTFVTAGDHRKVVAHTTFADGDWLSRAAALFLLSADLEAANTHFAQQPPQGRRGQRYIWLEAGHTSQNVYLQAAETGLGVVLVAGFHDDRIVEISPGGLPVGHHPLALLGFGHPAEEAE